MPVYELLLHIVLFLVGFSLFSSTIWAVIASMLVPRPTQARVLSISYELSSRLFRAIAIRRTNFQARDAVLAASGPASILIQLLVFIIAFLLALAMMLLAVSDLSANDSLYQAGATLLTLGIVEPVNFAQVVLTIIAAFVGLVVIAILVGYLLTLNNAYTQRESAITKLSLIAGEPAWGPEILCRRALLSDGEPQEFRFDDWIDWASDVRMTQSANPILNQYRSGSSRRNWVISCLAILDAAALGISTVRGVPVTSGAIRWLAEGSQTLAVLRHHELQNSALGRKDTVARDIPPTQDVWPNATVGERAVVEAIASDSHRSGWRSATDDGAIGVGLTRAEWDHGCDVMRRSGIDLVDDLDTAWEQFSEMRRAYAGSAISLAQSIYAVRAPWSGTRAPDTPTVWPALAVDSLPEAGTADASASIDD
ncbi:MAG: hypothetical protein ACOYD0_06405 [Candidatus Nanopelagicales bacterium]